MRDGTGKQVKVTFFTMVLSRSRYKFVWFSEVHFTAPLAVMAYPTDQPHISNGECHQ
jgi:hypothetical protein